MGGYIMKTATLAFLWKALVAVHHLQKPLAGHIIAQALETESLDLGDGDFGQAENNVPRLKMPSE